MTTGEALRAEGTEAVLAADTAAHRGYGDLVHDALDQLIASGAQFTAEDVRELVRRDHPSAVAHHPNLLPAVMGAAAKNGRITAVGITKPTRASRRASRNLVWKGVRP